jgi:broad specificity phosphatase PhoE
LLAPAGVIPLVEPELRERDVGEWTGLPTTEIDARYPGFREAHRGPPGFEGDEPLMARVIPALTDIARRFDDGTVVVIVTHGGVIRTMERHLGAVSTPVPNLAGRWLHATPEEIVLGDREVLIDPDDEPLTIPEEQ